MNPDIKKLQQAQVSCGSTEGRADEHKPDGQDAEEGSTNRVNDSEVCIRLLDPDRNQDQGLQQIPTPKHYQLQVPASGYQGPPAGNSSAGVFTDSTSSTGADNSPLSSAPAFITFDEEYGRTYKGRIYSGEMIEDLLGTVMRAERGELLG